jgi:hypothetical protein
VSAQESQEDLLTLELLTSGSLVPESLPPAQESQEELLTPDSLPPAQESQAELLTPGLVPPESEEC